MNLQEKRNKMSAMVDGYKKSGQSQEEYSRIHNIKKTTLSYWVRKHRDKHKDESPFIKIEYPIHQGIHIRYPNGVEMNLPLHTPVNSLKSLISI